MIREAKNFLHKSKNLLSKKMTIRLKNKRKKVRDNLSKDWKMVKIKSKIQNRMTVRNKRFNRLNFELVRLITGDYNR